MSPLKTNDIPIEETSPEEEIPLEDREILDIPIHFGNKGKSVSVQQESGNAQVQVNAEQFSSNQVALRKGALEAGYLSTLQSGLQGNPKQFLMDLKQNPNLNKVLRIQGAKKLGRKDSALAQEIAQAVPQGMTLRNEFAYACEQYLLTRKWPEGLSPEVQKSLKDIPSRGKNNALDFIASGRLDARTCDGMYQDYILPRYAELKEAEKQYSQTESGNYKPPSGPSEEKPMEESEIDTRIEPFFGGYYRGRIENYDPTQKCLVYPSIPKSTFVPENLPDDLEGHKRYTFSGVYEPGKENLLPLPYRALPLQDSLTTTTEAEGENSRIGGFMQGLRKRLPQGIQGPSLQIMRDEVGTFSIDPRNEAVGGKVKFKFDFILLDTPENNLNDEPVDENYESIGSSLDDETEEFLTQIQKENWLSHKDIARRCVAYTKKRLKYPEDNTAMEVMNQRYANTGSNLCTEILSYGIADCHWSNIFCGELCRRLGVAHRVPTGFHVKKDPRFNFAALAGTGHAWTEVWDTDRKEWVRMDATAPKENEDEDEENEEDSEETEGDYGEQGPEEQEELTPEEIEALFEVLMKQEKKQEDPSSEIFEQEKGVPLAKWQQVERFIQGVNQTRVEAKDSITQRTSTIKEEWKALFDLIYQRREIPQADFRGPVRQSEGAFLDDAVDAYIDVKAGESDPMGFKVDSVRTKEVIEATEFEEDEILDLTGSMEGFPAEQQKRMVLASAYNMMHLNNKLNLSHHRSHLRTSLRLKKRIASFFGASGTKKHLDSEDQINEKTLCKLYDKLSETKAGAGNLSGALEQYKRDIPTEVIRKIKQKKLIKVLTIVSDGKVNNQSRCVELVQELRAMGIKVQGLGFWAGAQTIKVICHDPNDPEAAQTIDNVSQSALARHKMLVKHLKNV